MTPGEIIRQGREAAGLTRKELAARIHTHISTLTRWERDLQHPRPAAAVRLERVLDVSLPRFELPLEQRLKKQAAELYEECIKGQPEFQIPWRIRFAYRRLSQGLSQVDLAKQLGISQTTISQWETGKAEPSPRHLVIVHHFMEGNHGEDPH